MKLLDKLRWDLRVASGAMGFTFYWGKLEVGASLFG